MSDEQEIDDMLMKADNTERLAKDVAMQHIQGYAPFVDVPAGERDRGIHDFDVIANTGRVFKGELTWMLERDITAQMKRLRPQLIVHPQINSVRLAVLAHVSMVIGADELAKCHDLWAAISANQWDDAQDALLMTKWPSNAVTGTDRKRVLELSRMMRTGVVPLAWTAKPN